MTDATDVLSAYQTWGLKQVPAELTTGAGRIDWAFIDIAQRS